jgi:purine-binding chemotaxis protein CheW
MNGFVIFEVASETLALPLGAVEQVVRMVALAPAHDSPRGVEGWLDLHGELVPTVDVRERLGLPLRGALPGDQLLLVQRGGARFALRVDRVVDVAAATESAQPGVGEAGRPLPRAIQYAGGVAVVPALEALEPAA